MKLVKRLRAACLALPVILASGGIDVGELSQYPWLQPATVLPKSFTSDRLLGIVIEMLGPAGRDLAYTGMAFPASHDSHRHWGINE